jgi:hypothetical protein
MFDEAGRVVDQPLEPLELVVELGAGPRIAVGQVEAADDDPADRGLEIAAVAVVGIAGQTAAGLVNLPDAAEDGDAVPALLAVPARRVARVGDGLRGEALVGLLSSCRQTMSGWVWSSQRSRTERRPLTPLTL